MRLKSVKLAGFKSFVDPTTVNFPRNMSGVVGPNGCGKSNIIDAVRWVMGESSAKHLRGESMADVIFNGSHSRKPVGQASIELIFDNTGGTIKGEFAAYNEVSVKRKVNRDCQTQYYLNGNKCRKRDITDLFLGTGLGPRSYAIIEQGMISRLVESKPEELRVFIEEAAGISKYKERRRETENRMKHTRENLERLTDIREELDKQLQHLQRQARAAERYKELKSEERHKKALLSAYRWNQLDHGSTTLSGELRREETSLERLLRERTQIDNLLEQLRTERYEAGEALNQAQADYYGSGAEIAKVEQQIKSTREREQQLRDELAELSVMIQETSEELGMEREQLAGLEEELGEVDPALKDILGKAGVSEDALVQAENRMQAWQQKWDELTQSRSDLQKTAEIEQARIQQTEKQIEQFIKRKAGLVEEKESALLVADDMPLAELREHVAELEYQQEEKFDLLAACRDKEKSLKLQLESVQAELNEVNTRRQKLRGEESSLQALQQHDDSATDVKLTQWLRDAGLAESSSLTDHVTAKPEWETALEALLGNRVKARVLRNNGQLSADAEEVPWQGLQTPLPEGLLLVAGDKTTEVLEMPVGSVSGVAEAFQRWYGDLRPVRDIEEAVALVQGNPEVLCLLADGTLVARHWLSGPPRRSTAMGMLTRHRRAAEVADLIQQEETSYSELENQKQTLRASFEKTETEQEQIRRDLNELNKQLIQRKAEVSAREAREEQLARRRANIDDELMHLEQMLEDEKLNFSESREVWQQALLELENSLEHKEQLLDERDVTRTDLDRLRSQARHDQEQAHQLQVRKSALTARGESVRQALVKTEHALQRSQVRRQMVEDSFVSQGEPQQDQQLQLEEWLSIRLQQEDKLAAARDHLAGLENSLKSDEARRMQSEQAIQEARGSIEVKRMHQREAEVRKATLRDQLAENQLAVQQLLPMLATEDSEPGLQAGIDSLAAKISRLGAINLAAIDEYKDYFERKVYLDGQNDDLQEALETLESAIRKIDKETRIKFRETFDQVNEGLQNLFPQVFGGGNACLELTEDDLLETGVAIMARPPGKKNSTIHLLSGGEKALTAIALVFSIFQLNPAPFCMLDEVDAPLDDANVDRYARMVKKMSEQVQFIYITHNKIAIEMADHLLGVTMHEPGVSRLVSVDVEEAAAMAAM